jgi:nucleotide-binding universal stress UspA family protein
MPIMRKIVAPVTFAANAINAARYAADLAVAIEAELHLVYVLPAPNLLARRPLPDFVYQDMRDSGYILLNDLRTELMKRTANKVPVTTSLETGEVPEQLQACCRRIKPFLVIMGAGESLSEQPDTSNTLRAMHQLPYPLLIIPPGASFHGIHHVAIACDQEDIYSGVTMAIPFLRDLHTVLGAKFDMVHVVVSGQGIGRALQEYDSWKSQLEAFGRQLHIVRQDEVQEGVQYFLENHPVDWLLVLPKKHALIEFHRSKAKEIALHSPVPVMSLHE